MPRARALAQFGERWKPHRSLAAWYLWRANDLARRKLLPRAARPPRIALQPLPKKKSKKTPKKKMPKKAPRRPQKSARRRARARR
jgi:DNA-3-methyladenine glycosylase II